MSADRSQLVADHGPLVTAATAFGGFLLGLAIMLVGASRDAFSNTLESGKRLW